MLEWNHIACLLDVADTRSFSRTAERMRLAQSVISKRVRRVEEQLGLRIFARTSRSVELTPEGRAFLPFAQAMIDAEEAARYAARTMHQEMAKRLILGTYDFFVSHRMDLMDAFHAEHADVQTEVVVGSRREMLTALRTGKIDVAMLASPVSHVELDFVDVRLPKLHAHLLVSSKHPLFDRPIVGPADLDGLEIVYSPTHQDPLVRSEIASRLMRHGARLVLAPEADRSSMEHFADIRGLPILRWEVGRRGRQVIEGKALLDFTDTNIAIEVVVHALRGSRRPVVDRFLDCARTLATSMAGSATR